MKLAGKTAIITGAGRGLGKAAALAMAGEGAAVVVLSRTAAELAETAGAIEAQGHKVLSFVADVAKRSDIGHVITETITAFGRIDILMNNAAVTGPLKPFAEVPDDAWRKTMAVNLDAVFHLSRAVLPGMVRQNSGKIITVTSGLAQMVMPPLGVYSVSKAAINHFIRILAAETQPYNIQVNGLDPGIMDTRMQEEIRQMGPAVLGRELYQQFVDFKEKGLLDPPEKVAELAVFLASSEADTVSGEIGAANHFAAFGFRTKEAIK